MKKLMYFILAGAVILTLGAFKAYAQEEDPQSEGAISGGVRPAPTPGNGLTENQKMIKKYDAYYDKDKFERLAGDDGTISQKDWEDNRVGKEDFGGDARWDNAIKNYDANGDGVLDLQEAKAAKQGQLQEAIEHKDDVNWLKNHPHAAKTLAGHEEFLRDHPAVAQRLAEDKEWMAKHPETAGALYRNREFLKDHPQFTNESEKFFTNHPEMRERAADRPRAFQKGVNAAERHPGEAGKVYGDLKDHPRAGQKVGKYADKHPEAATKAYKAGKAREGTGANKAAYKAGKNHPGAVQKGARNPGKARAAGRSRR